jgi:hypothetical protein
VHERERDRHTHTHTHTQRERERGATIAMITYSELSLQVAKYAYQKYSCLKTDSEINISL